MTPTAQLADIVLPVATHFEFDDLGCWGFQVGKILARPKLIEPPGECRSDVMILNELGARLELEDTFWKSEEEMINHILAPSGINYGDLKEIGALGGQKKYEKFVREGFRTKSGKVEIYSSWMKKNGHSPLPVFSEMEGFDERTDFILTSAKLPWFFHSMNRNIPSLRRRHPEPRMSLHPDTAEGLGVQENDWVWVENEQGKVQFKVGLDFDLDPRVVLVEHGWWFPEKGASVSFEWKRSNINILTKNQPPYEPSMGTVNLRGIPCRVYKVLE